jgi:hypothetical protein
LSKHFKGIKKVIYHKDLDHSTRYEVWAFGKGFNEYELRLKRPSEQEYVAVFWGCKHDISEYLGAESEEAGRLWDERVLNNEEAEVKSYDA